MDSIGIAASGMRVASLRLDATASNVARQPLADSQRLGVSATALVGGGVQGQVVAAAPDDAAPVADLVASRSAVLAFDANARVLRASDDSIGFLLDVTA